MSPIYSLFCEECDESFDRILSAQKADKVQWCEKCGSQLRREVEIPAKMVRGSSGWSSPA